LYEINNITRGSCGNLGRHLIAELGNCNSRKLSDEATGLVALLRAAEIAGATVYYQGSTKFSQNPESGYTGFVTLAESHISIHTWPEYGYAAIDLFTCGEMKITDAMNYLVKYFESEKREIFMINRGVPGMEGKLNHKVIM
jgi:S-adenosylmethionine decarboxylase